MAYIFDKENYSEEYEMILDNGQSDFSSIRVRGVEEGTDSNPIDSLMFPKKTKTDIWKNEVWNLFYGKYLLYKKKVNYENTFLKYNVAKNFNEVTSDLFGEGIIVFERINGITNQQLPKPYDEENYPFHKQTGELTYRLHLVNPPKKQIKDIQKSFYNKRDFNGKKLGKIFSSPEMYSSNLSFNEAVYDKNNELVNLGEENKYWRFYLNNTSGIYFKDSFGSAKFERLSFVIKDNVYFINCEGMFWGLRNLKDIYPDAKIQFGEVESYPFEFLDSKKNNKKERWGFAPNTIAHMFRGSEGCGLGLMESVIRNFDWRYCRQFRNAFSNNELKIFYSSRFEKPFSEEEINVWKPNQGAEWEDNLNTSFIWGVTRTNLGNIRQTFKNASKLEAIHTVIDFKYIWSNELCDEFIKDGRNLTSFRFKNIGFDIDFTSNDFNIPNADRRSINYLIQNLKDLSRYNADNVSTSYINNERATLKVPSTWLEYIDDSHYEILRDRNWLLETEEISVNIDNISSKIIQIVDGRFKSNNINKLGRDDGGLFIIMNDNYDELYIKATELYSDIRKAYRKFNSENDRIYNIDELCPIESTYRSYRASLNKNDKVYIKTIFRDFQEDDNKYYILRFVTNRPFKCRYYSDNIDLGIYDKNEYRPEITTLEKPFSYVREVGVIGFNNEDKFREYNGTEDLYDITNRISDLDFDRYKLNKDYVRSIFDDSINHYALHFYDEKSTSSIQLLLYINRKGVITKEEVFRFIGLKTITLNEVEEGARVERDNGMNYRIYLLKNRNVYDNINANGFSTGDEVYKIKEFNNITSYYDLKLYSHEIWDAVYSSNVREVNTQFHNSNIFVVM